MKKFIPNRIYTTITMHEISFDFRFLMLDLLIWWWQILNISLSLVLSFSRSPSPCVCVCVYSLLFSCVTYNNENISTSNTSRLAFVMLSWWIFISFAIVWSKNLSCFVLKYLNWTNWIVTNQMETTSKISAVHSWDYLSVVCLVQFFFVCTIFTHKHHLVRVFSLLFFFIHSRISPFTVIFLLAVTETAVAIL